MGTCGHVTDMVLRFRYNEELKRKIRNHYRDLRKSYFKTKSHHIEFSDQVKLSDFEMNKIKLKIRNKLIRERRLSIIKTASTFLIVLFLLSFVIYMLLR